MSRETPCEDYDLRIWDAEIDGDTIMVDLYGGNSNACGTVGLGINDAEARAHGLRRILHWRDRDARITLSIDQDTNRITLAPTP